MTEPFPFDDEELSEPKTEHLSPGQIRSIHDLVTEDRLEVDTLIRVISEFGCKTLAEVPREKFPALWASLVANAPRIEKWRWPEQPTRQKKPPARRFRACVHVMEGKEFPQYHLGDDLAGNDCFWLLCDLCYWGEHPFHDDPFPEGLMYIHRNSDATIASLLCTEVSEAHAIERKWIPQSRSMQFLYWLTADTTAGLAVSTWGVRLGGTLRDCGLFPSEVSYVYDFYEQHEHRYTEDEIRCGRHAVSEAEEAEVERILKKRSDFLRAARAAR